MSDSHPTKSSVNSKSSDISLRNYILKHKSWESTLQIIHDVISPMQMFVPLLNPVECFHLNLVVGGLRSRISEWFLPCHTLTCLAPPYLGYVQCTEITVNGFSTVNFYCELTKVQLKGILVTTNHKGYCSPVSRLKGLLHLRKVLLVWLTGCKSQQLDKDASFIPFKLWWEKAVLSSGYMHE